MSEAEVPTGPFSGSGTSANSSWTSLRIRSQSGSHTCMPRAQASFKVFTRTQSEYTDAVKVHVVGRPCQGHSIKQANVRIHGMADGV